ncbi:MAG TPA: hypothetical protein VG538_11520 [Vicinamibacterales bacterium]|jgi:predicted aspartyl protease|nr:hypothetical protein [Vicinamibacterales bacterium]
MIDTGFNGTLMLPVALAKRLRVFVESTTTVSLADDTSKNAWTTHVVVRVGDRELLVLALIEPDCLDLIIGMDFLRLARLGLVITPNGVLLVSENELSIAAPPVRRKKRAEKRPV